MSVLMLAIICTVMVATSFLSGLFGMAGGLVLIGVLLFIMPVPISGALLYGGAISAGRRRWLIQPDVWSSC